MTWHHRTVLEVDITSLAQRPWDFPNLSSCWSSSRTWKSHNYALAIWDECDKTYKCDMTCREVSFQCSLRWWACPLPSLPRCSLPRSQKVGLCQFFYHNRRECWSYSIWVRLRMAKPIAFGCISTEVLQSFNMSEIRFWGYRLCFYHRGESRAFDLKNDWCLYLLWAEH